MLFIGKDAAQGAVEYFISAIPDLMILLPIAFLKWRFIKNPDWKFISRLDVILVGVVFLNLLLGSILSGEAKLIILGVRLTYIPIGFYFLARLMYSVDFFELLKKFLSIMMYWFTLVAGFGLLMYYVFPEADNQLNEWVGGQQGEYFIKRLNSIFYSPTVNGMFCCMAAVYYLLESFKKSSPLNLFLLSVNFWALLLTVSRGGIIAFFLIIIILIIQNRSWKNIGISLSTLTVVFFLALYSVGLTLSNFSWIFTSTAETIGLEENVSRVELWKRTFNDFKERPLGYGIGKSGWIAYRYLKGTDTESAYLATDGWYLKVANETGIFGLVSFLTLLAFFFFRFLSKIKLRDDQLFLFLILLAVILVNLVSNVLDYFMFNAIFWFFMGALENDIKHNCKVCVD